MGHVPNLFNLWVVVYAALGSTGCAYALAILSSTLGQPTWYTSMGLALQGQPGYARTARYIGAINGLSSAGSALGSLYSGWSADSLSRKYTIQIGAVLLVLGAALSAGSANIGMFMAARFISGWGIGIMITVIPMYQSEVSTPETRGFMVSMYGVMGAFGYTLSSWIGFGMYFLSASGSTSTVSWRFPLAFQAIPSILLLIGSPWLPFTPRWLMQKGRFDEADAVLKRLHATRQDENHDLARKEFIQMRKQLELDREIGKSNSRFELIRTAANRRRVLVAFILMWGAQFTGPLVIASYGVILFIQLGLTGYMPLLLLGIWTTIAIPGNLVTALFVDRVGRRTFLLIGAVGLLITLVLECALQAQYTGTANKSGQRAAIFFIYLFIIIYTACIDATQFVYLSEIFPTHIRSQGVGFGIFNWFLGSIILLVAGPTALDRIGWKFFLVLIVPTAFYIIGIYYLFPETRQRSLEDINAEFGEKVAVRYFHATESDEKEYQHAIEIEDVVQKTAISVDQKV